MTELSALTGAEVNDLVRACSAGAGAGISIEMMIDEFFGFSHAKSFDADMRAALALREEAAGLHPPVWLGYPLHPDANEVA